MNFKAIAGAVGIFAGGVVVGVGATRTYWEGKIRAEYKESSDAYRRAMELVRHPDEGDPNLEDPDQIQIDFNEVATTTLYASEDGSVFESPIDGTIMITPIDQEPVQNDYHKAIEASETPHEMFVSGAVNDYGVSYIEEEEYLDEDGRFKGKIDIMMDEHNPIFLMDGNQITDWDQRVGASILVDFYRLVPPGADDVLYVRNHRTGDDYEVVRVHP